MHPDTSTDSPWYDWPRCPICAARRQTACPVCEVAGADFQRGFYPSPSALASDDASTELPPQEAGPETGGVLLVCPTCDEVFEPTFYRYCHQCGYDFHQGVEVDVPRYEPLPPRAVVVLVGVVVLLVALGWFFAWVLR